jgi:hypothetical protein
MSKIKNLSEDITKAPPHAMGPEKSTLSSMLQEPGRFIRQALNENLVADDYYIPAHRHLYQFLLKLHEQGEQIELVSLVQRLLDNGQLDRIGGASTLAELHNYAIGHSHFSLHLSQVKDKAVLREIIRKANAQIRAAYEQPDEVKELVNQLASDAAEMAVKTENRASDFKKYREQIVTPDSMKEQVVSYLNGDRVLGGDGFFLSPFDLAFRKHEWTVWCGTSTHGKSQAVQNQLAWLASLGRKSIIASLEQPPEITLGQILKAMTAYKDIARSEEFEPAWGYINTQIQMYRGQRKTSPKHLIETFRQAYLNNGTDTGVIDNLMCLQVDRGDNSALANAIDMFRVFVSEYPFHLHLVVHPRKPGGNESPNRAPTQADIRGPAEIGDQPNNVIVISRDLDKSRKLAEMEAGHFSKLEREAFWQSTPCGKIAVEKQRMTGSMPIKHTWFDPVCNQFMDHPGKARPMFLIPPWEVEPSA